MKIGNIEFGQNKGVLVIPEIGINHEGSLKVAKEMVDAAHRAGARLIKHQTHICSDEMAGAAKKVIPGNSDVSIYDVMERCALNEEEEQLLLFISSSGTYGTLENSVKKGVKEKGKTAYFMERVFPPYRFYKSAYPWAYYCPILIPIAWLCRFFRILFKNPKKAKDELTLISKQKEEKK